jgi:5-methyltetrahydropteroyltriglutamate--homocysteine methyltransferase
MIRTTVVGSWPIPFGLKPKLTRYYKGAVGDDEARGVLQAAARIAMDEQLACGLDQIMGGEVFAPDFVHHVPPRLAGLEVVRERDHRVGAEGIGRYRIAGDLSAPRGTGHALAYRREREIEPALDKAAVPSVLTMTLSFAADPRLPEQLPNVARFVADEVRDMVAAGAREVQLDAPFEAILLLLESRQPEEIAPWLVRPFRDVEGIRRTVHFCLGDMGRRPATQEQHLRNLIPLIQRLEGQIDRVHLECSYTGQWDERGLLERVPESMEVIAGIADVKSPPQSAEALRERIEALLEVLPAERLLVSSSCGCGRVPHDEAILLMRNLVQAARSV